MKRLHNSKTFTFLRDRASDEKKWMTTRITNLLEVEKFKSEFSEKLGRSPSMLLTTESPLRKLPPHEYHSIRKDLQTFSNIKHKRTISDGIQGREEKEALTFRGVGAGATTERTSRAVSVLTMRDKIASVLGTTRSGLRILRRKPH